jgi:hypothetical protein
MLHQSTTRATHGIAILQANSIGKEPRVLAPNELGALRRRHGRLRELVLRLQREDIRLQKFHRRAILRLADLPQMRRRKRALNTKEG